MLSLLESKIERNNGPCRVHVDRSQQRRMILITKNNRGETISCAAASVRDQPTMLPRLANQAGTSI